MSTSSTQSMSDDIPARSSDIQIYHSPNTILNIYAGYLRSLVDNKVISIRGVYVSDPNAKSYSGYHYEYLKGENDTISLKIKVPALVRSKLQNKQIYVFSGFLEKKVALSSVELVFCIDNVLVSEKSQYSEAELEGFKIIQQKVALGYVDVEAKIRDSVYENKKLRIANIYGESAIVDKDFQRGISGAVVNFEIQNFRCNLSQPVKIVETLKGISNMGYDIIAIVRGGGELSALNDPTIASQVLKLSCVFVCAIGHAVNETLLDKIADKSFELPLHYGVKLREIVERANEDLTNSKSVLLNKVRTEVAKSFTDTLKANEEQVKLLKEQLKNATESNLEKDKYYTKLIEDRVSKIYKDNQNDVRTMKQEHKTSQYIALVIGFALAMLIIYIFRS